MRILADRIAPDGYQLEDQREGLLWGFVNVFNEQTKRLDREIAAVNRDTEIAPTEKEAAREALQERKYVFEELHAAASALYFDETRRVWDTKARDKLPPVTSTKLEFEAFVKNRERALHAAQAPEGAVVIVHGDRIEGKLELFHYEQLSRQLDAIREKHGEIIVAHGAYSQGVDKLTAIWCEQNGVSQIQCPPKYARYKNSSKPAARAAFERNREMFAMPDVCELVIFGEASTGTAANMLELAQKRNENTLRHARLLAEMDPEARERNGWVGPPVPVPVNPRSNNRYHPDPLRSRPAGTYGDKRRLCRAAPGCAGESPAHPLPGQLPGLPRARFPGNRLAEPAAPPTRASSSSSTSA